MNVIQICPNTSDLVPLYLPLELYLKPIARVSISVRLCSTKVGTSISYWEIMDKLRDLARPEEFTTLKVAKTTVEFVIFEGEIETVAKLEKVISKLHNKMIRLKDFKDLMRVRAGKCKSDFPTQPIWDDFFQNAKDMNEMKPGERPDTIHLANLPSKWFTINKNNLPSEKIFQKIFEKFGPIRKVDIPICDPFRKKMNDQISGIKNCSLENTDFFEAYIQFQDYCGFKIAMDALFNKKMVHKDLEVEEVNIKVDFDKSKHLSDASIRRREIVRERLILKMKKKEEKERSELEENRQKEALEKQKQSDIKAQKHLRRQLREEKRKARILQKLQIDSTDEINNKIAKEEQKLLNVQRKLEAIRLVEELYKRIKEKNLDSPAKIDDKEAHSFDKIKKLRYTSELDFQSQKQKLSHAMKGREMLKTILSKKEDNRSERSSSDTELSLDESPERGERSLEVFEKYPELLYDSPWLRYPYNIPSGFLGGVYPDYVNMFRGFGPHRRPFGRFPNRPGTSRGTPHNRRGHNYNRQRNYNRNFNDNTMQHLEKVCKKYFNKLIDKDSSDGEYRRSRSRIRRRSRTRSYSYSRSRSRTRSRSYGRKSSRSHSRDRSYRSSRSRSISKEKSKSRSRSSRKSKSKSRDRAKSENYETNSKNDKTNKTEITNKSKHMDLSSGRTPSPKQRDTSNTKSESKSSSRPENRSRSWSRSPE